MKNLKQYTVKELRQALANVPDDAGIYAIVDVTHHGLRNEWEKLIVEHYSWAEPRTIEELINEAPDEMVTLMWTSDAVEKMFLEEKDCNPTMQDIVEVLTEFDNEVHDRLTPHGNELMREIINRA